MARTKIAVLGAGNMGTAMAHTLADKGHAVTVWDHFPKVVEDIRLRRINRRFLPGVRLHPNVRATADARDCVAGAALVVLSVPSAFAASTLSPILPQLEANAILLNLAKGFAPRSREPLPLMLARLAPGHPCAHLAGPAIANEFARGRPAAIVLAVEDALVACRVAAWLSGPVFLPSTTTDVAGAALGGILKNVYAILLGAVHALGGGSLNLEAAVLSASVHEMAAIARGSGGDPATLYGFAGLGDLAATGFSRDSHNRRFGQMLAAGKTTRALEKEAGWLPEGARAASAACTLARASRVRAPLAALAQRWLRGESPSLPAVFRALHRAQTGESKF